ncbi:MAG: sigma-70 family RNA polymerase sigma factor [Actinobacteria bacterium]|nr:sigma-70 family RNA polymerase sigma factor [Actinomycetota bacterium]
MNPRPPPDDEWLALALERFAVDRSDALRVEIAGRVDWLARRCASRFMGRGEPFDDLLQVARIGLLKAIDRFDAVHGVPFGAFATPTIVGELRRHFRDHTWGVHVSRTAKDRRGGVNAAVEELTKQLGRSPRVPELARHLGLPEDTVIEVMEASLAYRPDSFDPDNPGHERPFADDVPDSLDRAQVIELLTLLPTRERTILYLRFYEELSQADIAERLGTSQVHVGRLIAASLAQLRRVAGDDRG